MQLGARHNHGRQFEMKPRAYAAYEQWCKDGHPKTNLANALLLAIADAIETNESGILAANREDIESSGLEGAMRDRLLLTSSRIKGTSRGVRAVAALPDHGEQLVVAEGPGRGPVQGRDEPLRHILGRIWVDARPVLRLQGDLEQRRRQPIEFGPFVEELGQFVGELRMTGQDFALIQRAALVDRLQTGEDDCAEPLVAFGDILRHGVHKSPRLGLPE